MTLVEQISDYSDICRHFNTMNRLTTMSREIHAQQKKH